MTIQRARAHTGLIARPSTPQDRELHAALFAESRRDDLLGSGLDVDRAERMAAFQEETFEQTLHLHDGFVEDLTWVLNGWPLGRLVLHHASARVRVVWVVVAESGRRQKVATDMINSVLAEHDRVTTRIRPDNNAAQRLFEGLGFRVVDQSVGERVLLFGPQS